MRNDTAVGGYVPWRPSGRSCGDDEDARYARAPHPQENPRCEDLLS